MEWWEVQHFIDGNNRRQHPIFEAIRLLGYIIVCMFSDKEHKPKSPKDLMEFTWEKKLPNANAIIEEEKELQSFMDQLNAHNRQVEANAKAARE